MFPSFRRVLACLALASLLAWTGCRKAESPAADPPAGPAGDSQERKAPEKLTSAMAVLERMAEVYKKASRYADFGTVQLQAQTTRGPIDWSADYSVKLVRPNKLRVKINEGEIVADGQKWNAWVRGLPDQVVVRDPPVRLAMELFFADKVLAQELSRGLDGQLPQFPLSPQLPLLLADNPVPGLLAGAEEPGLVEPGKIGDAECYRVQVKSSEGVTVFWIDRETFVLRRLVFPVATLWQRFGGEQQVQSLSLVADFVGAQLDAAVDPKAFQFEVPQGTRQVRMFQPPDMFQFLGKRLPDFKFIDGEGKPVTPGSLTGKVAVLNFWDTGCEPCRLLLPELEKLYQKEKGNDKLAFFAVSMDPKEVENKAVQDVLSGLKVTMPLVRDPEQQALTALRVFIPTTLLILGTDGTLQQCEVDDMKEFLAALPGRLEKLLSGEDLSKEAAARYQGKIHAQEKAIDRVFQGKLAEDPTEPQTLKLTRLWKAAEVKSPGNILVVPGGGPAPRIFVIDELKSIVELGTDGRVLARRGPDAQGEVICNLRTAIGGDGKRVFAAFALSGQQFFSFDENWKQTLAFPDETIKTTHKGIADVQLADADGSGQLKAYVGYYDATGIQAVSLAGKRLWSNRTLLSVVRTALAPPDAQGRRSILCACQSENGALAILDAAGNRQGQIVVSNWPIGSIVGADLKGDGAPAGPPLWAALSVNPEGQTVILGISLKGDVLWNYPLP
ncbi:MAG: redoxin domain-containing protein, partial [Thermoguttaceae bacterium]